MKKYTIEINFFDDDIAFDIELENEEKVKEFICKMLAEKNIILSGIQTVIVTDKIQYISWFEN